MISDRFQPVIVLAVITGILSLGHAFRPTPTTEDPNCDVVFRLVTEDLAEAHAEIDRLRWQHILDTAHAQACGHPGYEETNADP